jgi:hemoglobin
MSEQYGVGDASYQAAGGIDGLRRLVDDFYRCMDELPEAAEVRAMHPASLDSARDKLACFLSGWLEAQAKAWLTCMARAIERQNYAPAFAEYLLTQLRVPARRIVQASAARHSG